MNDLYTILCQALEHIAVLPGVFACCIVLPTTAETGWLVAPPDSPLAYWCLEAGYIEQAIRQREIQVVTKEAAPSMVASPRALLCLPLLEGERAPYGVLLLDAAIPVEQRPLLSAFAHQLALTLGTVERARAISPAPAQESSQHEVTRANARFLSLMTHELRAPLHTIHGYLDLALNEVAGELNPQLREFLQRARSSSEHLFGMVENLLLLSRADMGQLHLKREDTRLQEIFVDAIEEMEVTARDKNVAITVDIADDFPPLYTDSSRLQQVIRNLLSNALRFTSEGGRVKLAARIEDLDQQRVASIYIDDNGPGIAPIYHERIFERFFQVPESGQSGGQGIGLAIVKMIIELHGGIVQVNSAPGSGSIFLCQLPLHRNIQGFSL